MKKKNSLIPFNKKTINQILKFFNAEKDIVIVIKPMKSCHGMLDEKQPIIYINKDTDETNKVLTLVHELIHWKWGVNHDGLGWYCGYYSSKHDHLSETIGSIVFGKKMVWED